MFCQCINIPCFADESLFPSEALIKMKEHKSSPLALYMVHPIEGHVDHLQQLASHLDATVYGLQCDKDAPLESIEQLAAHYIQVGDPNDLGMECETQYSYLPSMANQN